MAAQRLQAEIMTREIQLPPPDPAGDGRLRLVKPADAIADFAKVYEQLRAERTGWSSRDDRWWRFVLSDLPSRARRRHRAARRRARHPARPDRVRDLAHRSANGTRTARTPRCRSARWWPATRPATRRCGASCTTIDLARTATAGFLALDEPLQHLVDEPRRLGLTVADALWIRIVDLPRALSARRYATDVDVVLEVTDPLIPANTGRWRLTGGPDGGDLHRHRRPGRPGAHLARAGRRLPGRAHARRARRGRPGPGADPGRAVRGVHRVRLAPDAEPDRGVLRWARRR